MVSYGRRKNTIHIHVVPSDIRALLSRDGLRFAELQLIYAIVKIQCFIKDEKDLGRAILSKEKLLSEEWNIIKDNRKQELLNKCGLIKQKVEVLEKAIKASKISTHEQCIERLQHVESREINN